MIVKASQFYLASRLLKLFSMPSQVQVKRSVELSLFILLSSFPLIHMTPVDFETTYYLIALVLVLIHGYVTMTNSTNYPFLFRYVLIWVLIAGVSFAWFFGKGSGNRRFV